MKLTATETAMQSLIDILSNELVSNYSDTQFKRLSNAIRTLALLRAIDRLELNDYLTLSASI